MEQPEEIKAAEVSPEQAKSIEAETEVVNAAQNKPIETEAAQEVEPENKITDEHDERYHIAIRVRGGDDPSDVCDNMQAHLRLGKSVNLEGSGRLSVSNMILAVKNLESRLGFNIPVFLSFRKTYSHEYRKYLDIASIFVYPEYLTNKPEENNAVVAMHRIQQILDNWRMSMKKLAPTDGAAEADENQLAFPWCEGKSGDEKSVTHSE